MLALLVQPTRERVRRRITGHTYLTYGPLLNGASSLVFEGVPTYPDAGRCWQIVEKYKVSCCSDCAAAASLCLWLQLCSLLAAQLAAVTAHQAVLRLSVCCKQSGRAHADLIRSAMCTELRLCSCRHNAHKHAACR